MFITFHMIQHKLSCQRLDLYIKHRKSAAYDLSWSLFIFCVLLSIGKIVGKILTFLPQGHISCLFVWRLQCKRGDRYLDVHGRRRKWTPLQSHGIIYNNHYRQWNLQYLSWCCKDAISVKHLILNVHYQAAVAIRNIFPQTISISNLVTSRSSRVLW